MTFLFPLTFKWRKGTTILTVLFFSTRNTDFIVRAVAKEFKKPGKRRREGIQ